MNKKTNIAIIISITAFFIAVLSLLFVYVNHQESRKIAFKWEVNSDNGVLVKLERGLIDNEGKPEQFFNLPLWIQFKIANTGLRTFSVDSIWLVANIKNHGISRPAYFHLEAVDPKPQNIGDSPVSNEISFPLVVEPGHSKVFYKKIKLPISNRLYEAYHRSFKGKAFSIGEIYGLNNDDTRISNHFKIYAEVELGGGEKRNIPVGID